MSKSLIDIILDQIFDDNWKGRQGEKLTERELNLVKLFGRDGKVLRNVYVPKSNGETSEIDVLFISQKGIFVIESKNYSGWIFGNEADRYWTVSLPGGNKNRFYNPILQNRGHVKWLGQYLSDNTPLYSIIAFSERCKLKKVTVLSDDVRVIKRDRLYATVREIWKSAEDALSENEVENLHSHLKLLTNADEATKMAHVAAIEQKYASEKKSCRKNTDRQADVAVSCLDSACPRCGGELVLRTAKKGLNAGGQFYGCSNFPRCRFTRDV
ncbi:NERD domain-containing protein [Gordonibacter sp.]|uniref:NERD domain-containing protein n=1 Tax=Gordonibacter sp. TaxID=1968902 RepID=UPI002FCBAAD7